MPLGDETYTIILNSRAAGSAAVPQPLEELFRYMNDCEVAGDSELIRRIDNSVEHWNSPERRRIIMTYEQELLIAANKAREEGVSEGRSKERAETVHRMAQQSFSASEIARATGLSEDEVASMLQSLIEETRM